MIPADAVARLRLIRTDSIGPVTYRQLMARFGDAETALRALPDLARRGGRSLAVATVEAAETELAALDGMGATMIFIGTPAYPALLAREESAPPVLAARGDLLSDVVERCLQGVNVQLLTSYTWRQRHHTRRIHRSEI